MVAWVKNLRDFFKTISYGTAYGLSKWGLARRLHFDIDAAQALIDLFFKTYPKVGKWLKEQGRLALERGYSLTALGRKRYFRYPRPVTQDRVETEARKLMDKRLKVQEGVYTGNQYALWQQCMKDARRELDKEFRSRLASIERQGGNAPVQGTSADITKRAMLYVEQAVEKLGWKLEEGLLLPVHDELIAECDDEHADILYGIMKTQMERAALEILRPIAPNVRIVVKPQISEYWSH
jgi:DNA polymerase-1